MLDPFERGELRVSAERFEASEYVFGENVRNRGIIVSVESPDGHVLDTLRILPGIENSSCGYGCGEASGVLIDRGKRTGPAHRVSEAINPISVDLVLFHQYGID